MSRTIGVGIAGLGTVGAGVVRHLHTQREILKSRTGLDFVVRRAAVRDLSRDRGVDLSGIAMSTSPGDLCEDKGVDIVVELMGGIGEAESLIRRALQSGKVVVTANKALLAERGAEIFAMAEECGRPVFYEAAVAGGIPIIKSLKEAFVGNRFPFIHGILNGTSNYILTRMEEAGMGYAEALDEATRLGYAEADPTLDINGWDAAHKTLILASLAYGFWVSSKEILVRGIEQVSGDDVCYAAELGYRIKLLATIDGSHPDGIGLRVVPTLIPTTHVLASVSGVFNAVAVRGDVVGDTLFYGRGAGAEPTTSSVLGDLVEAGDALLRPPGCYGFTGHGLYGKCLRAEECVSRFYLRLSVEDRPGVLAEVAGILGASGIGISSVIQPGTHHGLDTVPLVLMIHDARAGVMSDAVGRIAALPSVKAPPRCLHVEDFE